MSSSRQKVSDDPLSMFGAREKTAVDPLSAAATSSTSPAVETTRKAPENEPASVFRELDASKVNFAVKKTKAADATAEKSPSSSGADYDRLGRQVWTSDLAKAKEPAVDTKKDILLDMQANSNASIFASDDRDIFGKVDSVTKRAEGIGAAKVPARVLIRGATDEADEENVKDLKVSKLLEREEDLDYDLFGKAKPVVAPLATVVGKKNMDIFEFESDEYINELEKLTNKKEKDISSSKLISNPAIAAVATKADIDIGSLDLNAYIAQQSESSGGLFD
jgi:hypothetical protein